MQDGFSFSFWHFLSAAAVKTIRTTQTTTTSSITDTATIAFWGYMTVMQDGFNSSFWQFFISSGSNKNRSSNNNKHNNSNNNKSVTIISFQFQPMGGQTPAKVSSPSNERSSALTPPATNDRWVRIFFFWGGEILSNWIVPTPFLNSGECRFYLYERPF